MSRNSPSLSPVDRAAGGDRELHGGRRAEDADPVPADPFSQQTGEGVGLVPEA